MRALGAMSDEPPAVDGSLVKVSVRTRRGAIVEAVRRLSEAGVGVDDLALRRPTLDDVFLVADRPRRREPEDEDDASRDGRGNRV